MLTDYKLTNNDKTKLFVEKIKFIIKNHFVVALVICSSLCTFAALNKEFPLKDKDVFLLAIESSCDETSAAVLHNNKALSNIIATQKVHEQYGGVVPELASRAHLQNIVPVVDAALKEAGVDKKNINAVAFTQAPGLIGSLLVGAGFAKSFAQAMRIPLIAVNHMQAHVLAHWLEPEPPQFPFLCLTVSGGHTQIVLCHDPLTMDILGETMDDAAGEAFDKIAKMLALPYPGGPLIDKHAQSGDPIRFSFPITDMPGYNFSFSGIKTSVLYFVRKMEQQDPYFLQNNMADLCASVQYTIVQTLMKKFEKAALEKGVAQVGIAGGVSANSGLRKALLEMGARKNWKVFLPKFEYCTDNAAMIGIAGYYKYLQQDFCDLKTVPAARQAW